MDKQTPSTSKYQKDNNSEINTLKKSHKRKITEMKKSITSLQNLVQYTDDFSKEYIERKKELNMMKEINEKLKENNKELKNALKSKEELAKELIETIEKNQSLNDLKILEMMNNLKDVEEKLSQALEENKNFQEINKLEREIIADLQKNAQEYKKIIKEKESEVIVIMDENKSSKDHNVELEEENKRLKKEIDDLNNKLIVNNEENIVIKRKFDDFEDQGNSKRSKVSSRTVYFKDSDIDSKKMYKISYNENSIDYKNYKCIKIQTNDLEFLRLATKVCICYHYAYINVFLKIKKSTSSSVNKVSNSPYVYIKNQGWSEKDLEDFVICKVASVEKFDELKEKVNISSGLLGELRLLVNSNFKEEYMRNSDDKNYLEFNFNEVKSLFNKKKVNDDVSKECQKLKFVLEDIQDHFYDSRKNYSEKNSYVVI
jgi:hypothetical protein